jgi:V/A-type H+-transporting ATPase subunit D
LAKIKYTKNELKAQRDALDRYRRFLPVLQLKKRQLQAEVGRTRSELDEKRVEIRALRGELSSWQVLFSEPVDIAAYLSIAGIDRGRANLVGVSVPELRSLSFHRVRPDYFSDPMWLDDGLDALERLARLELESRFLAESLRLLEAELLTTTQRVNLFEKVKIPEARDNIRRIRIFLGDQQTAAVARAKLAKAKFAGKEGAA